MYHHILSLKQSTLKDQDLSRVEEYNLIGTPDTILEKISQFTEAGVTHFCSLVFSTSTVEETLDQMQWFAEDVMGAIGT
jgi:alkanesulfonate monooxygenase SsuD/methylene tetrahydromethanopterin reductase-like flavin-dependent oxidoreductase (luciferase family)